MRRARRVASRRLRPEATFELNHTRSVSPPSIGAPGASLARALSSRRAIDGSRRFKPSSTRAASAATSTLGVAGIATTGGGAGPGFAGVVGFVIGRGSGCGCRSHSGSGGTRPRPRAFVGEKDLSPCLLFVAGDWPELAAVRVESEFASRLKHRHRRFRVVRGEVDHAEQYSGMKSSYSMP